MKIKYEATIKIIVEEEGICKNVPTIEEANEGLMEYLKEQSGTSVEILESTIKEVTE